MSNTRRQAEKSSLWAEQELVQAKDWAKNGTTPNAKREGRQMARAAKRRKARADRRAWKADRRNWE